jgi:hypothetical protein
MTTPITLDLSCPCGADLRLVLAEHRVNTLENERTAFNEAHAVCRAFAATEDASRAGRAVGVEINRVVAGASRNGSNSVTVELGAGESLTVLHRPSGLQLLNGRVSGDVLVLEPAGTFRSGVDRLKPPLSPERPSPAANPVVPSS